MSHFHTNCVTLPHSLCHTSITEAPGRPATLASIHLVAPMCALSKFMKCLLSTVYCHWSCVYCSSALLLRTAAVCCSLKLYNNLVEKCFKDCVLDFRSKNLGKDEQQVCVCGVWDSS